MAAIGGSAEPSTSRRVFAMVAQRKGCFQGLSYAGQSFAELGIMGVRYGVPSEAELKQALAELDAAEAKLKEAK